MYIRYFVEILERFQFRNLMEEPKDLHHYLHEAIASFVASWPLTLWAIAGVASSLDEASYRVKAMIEQTSILIRSRSRPLNLKCLLHPLKRSHVI